MVYFLCKAYDSDRQNCYFAQSLPVRGAWIEISSFFVAVFGLSRRSPCGERGLKSRPALIRRVVRQSLPVRGAWIEMAIAVSKSDKRESLPVRGAWIEIASCARIESRSAGRSPCGERGLKCPRAGESGCCAGRSPCGERGLKLSVARWRSGTPPSLPVRGAWIEMYLWREPTAENRSLPVRGAWIEISRGRCRPRCGGVAPRAGSVD